MTTSQPFRQAQDFIPRLKGVFFAQWNNHRGSQIVYEVPEGIITTSATTQQSLHFSSVVDYILPKKALSGHLVTICTDDFKILGYPCLIEDERYDRNILMFNVCFVFDREAEVAGYEPVVRKTGRILKSMEESNSFLSNESTSFQMKSVLEQLYEDLNSFSETSISIGDWSLDLKLFPFFGNPSQVRDWDVPLPLVALHRIVKDDWDITMRKLVVHIDGLATVKSISELADVDLYLARECMQHLLFFGACILIDLFQFSNSYALIGGPALIALGGDTTSESLEMQDECVDYVCDRPRLNSSSEESSEVVSISTLLELYTCLRPGFSLHEWMEEYQVHKLCIDIRRFVSFGVIKGFLRRVYCYPTWMKHRDLISISAKTRTRLPTPPTPLPPTPSPVPVATHLPEQNSVVGGLLKHQYPYTTTMMTSSSTSRRDSVTEQPVFHRTFPTKLTPQRNRHDTFSVNSTYSQPSLTQSTSTTTTSTTTSSLPVPHDLPLLLDGSVHTDELCVKYQVGHCQLELWLQSVGRSKPGHHEVHMIYI